jgi:hypothetical protein
MESPSVIWDVMWMLGIAFTPLTSSVIIRGDLVDEGDKVLILVCEEVVPTSFYKFDGSISIACLVPKPISWCVSTWLPNYLFFNVGGKIV